MKPEKKLFLSGMDIEAILTALPIVENFPADTLEQDLLNKRCCQSVRARFIAGRKDFTPNELRVIAVAVYSAAEYQAGHMPELEHIHPNISELRKYALVYPGLRNYFRPMIDNM